MDYRTELATITADASVSQNTDFFASDFSVKRAGNLVRISIQATTAIAINIVPSSGSAIHLGTLSANVVSTYTIALDAARTFNLQTSAADESTIEFCCVQEVQQ
jgi:hypothetical protein